jgi:hypothetical protein
MASGLHFAVLQASHFLLLEAHLSARSQSYFITLFFWLLGFLLGLQVRGDRWFGGLLAAGAAAYSATWALSRWMPFHTALYPAAALSAVVSALLAGHFFRFVAGRYRPLRRPLLHENNGFVLGLLIALKGAVHWGGWLLAGGPAITAALVALTFAAARRDLDTPTAG